MQNIIIRYTLTYGCEVWTTTSVTVRRLRTFENKIRRVIADQFVRQGQINEKEVQQKTGLSAHH